MIEAKTLVQLANRYQTSEVNIVREYFQHLFLSLLYEEKESSALLFKGGTALRFIWQSPRFSEDLDFTGFKMSAPQIESLMERVLFKIEREGVVPEIEESKRTTGGYLALFRFQADTYKSDIQIQISLRTHYAGRGEVFQVQPEWLPPYNLVHLDTKDLVQEKVEACLTRSKSRDFYDLYFILRGRMAFEEVFAKDRTLKKKLVKLIHDKNLDLRSELKRFLPSSHQLLLKNFKSVLLTEIERSLP